jgi:hypothetical protein
MSTDASAILSSPPPVTRRAYKRQADRNPEQAARILAAYASGQSGAVIATAEGVSGMRVTGVLKRAGVVMRRAGAPRAYTLDAAYFDAITDEARAYWVGFLLADGCVTDGDRLRLCLGVVDRAHLEAFRDAIGSTHPITERATKGGYKPGALIAHYDVRCARIAEGLARVGVIPRKSHTAVPPVLRPDLQRHFWRGMVDGDGYVSQSGRQVTMGLTGNPAVCEAFRAWAAEVCGTGATVTRNNTGWKVAVGGVPTHDTPVMRLLRALYADCTVALPRKLDKALALFAACPAARE